MTNGNKHRTLAATAFLLSIVMSPAAAEELVLKNGQKIVGTIVGYEKDMFRLKTEFGYALVRRDRVASINFQTGSSREPIAKKAETENAKPSAQPGAYASEVTSRPGAAGSGSNTAPASLISRPVDEPMLSNLKEHIEGTEYISDTFRFAMFKPPDWKTFEGVHRETGSAIVAMGTDDEQTLLFVDRQVWSGAPNLDDDRTEANLRRSYQNYQKLSEARADVDGHPAIRRVFQGVLDGMEWHGVSVHVARGSTVFGIIGLTSAEMFQFELAVFNKMIRSFRFLAGSPEASTMPSGGPRPLVPSAQ